MPHEFPITDTPRYREIADKFGMIAHEQGICGCHVHVAVPSREVAVRVSNRLRPWLPLFLALTANSAVYRNTDTGYASWRSILWAALAQRGTAAAVRLRRRVRRGGARCFTTAGAMLDDGMVYWDVRPSAKFPTIEVRVADVPATVAETVLLATLIRASVMTALDDERRGEPTPPLTPHALKAAYWKSARDGLDGEAIDLLESHAPRARAEVVGAPGRPRPARPRGRRRLRHGEAPSWRASTTRATARCGSAGRGSDGTTWKTSSPSWPPRRCR